MKKHMNIHMLTLVQFVKTFENSAKLSNCEVKLRNASGVQMKVYGSCRTKIELGRTVFPARFIVVDNLKRPAILGRDFMSRYNVIMNYVLMNQV